MDAINVEIAEDGTLAITTDQVSAANHRNADEALKMLMELMGGEVTETKRKATHSHQSAHNRARQGG